MATGAGVLTIGDYLGGPDSINFIKSFQGDQSTQIWNFGTDVTGWTFTAQYQTLIVNPVSFNRYTGAPNFANSNVIGYFPLTTVISPYEPEVTNVAAGTVNVYIPANMYTGAVLPDQRQNTPISIYAFTWTNANSIPVIQSWRYAFIHSWMPGVELGDPTLESSYTAITLGA